MASFSLFSLLLAFLYLNSGKISLSMFYFNQITIIPVSVSNVYGSICTRSNVLYGSKKVETFSCPRLLESSDKQFCCGTKLTRYCCERSKYDNLGNHLRVARSIQDQRPGLVYKI